MGLVTVWPLLSMRPAATGAVGGTEIVAVNNGMNSLYVLPAGDGHLAIDAGTDAEKAEQAMKAMGIDPLAVTHVLLTHSDSDHVAALALFANAQIYMGENELQMVDGTTRRNAAQFNALPGGIDQGSLVLLQDGQALTIGGHRIVCLSTPRHTPGSMSYLLDDACLFTGDALRVNGAGVEIHPFTMDAKTADASVQKLREAMAGCALVLTAHYGYCRADTLK